VIGNQIKGKLTIALSVFIILLGVAATIASNHSASESKGVNISAGYVINGDYVDTKAYGGTVGEDSKLSSTAKAFKTISYALYVGGAIGFVCGIRMCKKRDKNIY
jgi:hypothetical protein